MGESRSLLLGETRQPVNAFSVPGPETQRAWTTSSTPALGEVIVSTAWSGLSGIWPWLCRFASDASGDSCEHRAALYEAPAPGPVKSGVDGRWQSLEITVRIGYMHNAAHPQSLPRVRQKEAASRSGREWDKCVPDGTAKWTPPAPNLLGESKGAVPCFHSSGPGPKPIDKAQWGGPGLQATVRYMHWVGRACQRTPVGTWLCNPPAPPCPSLACHPRCLSWPSCSLGAGPLALLFPELAFFLLSVISSSGFPRHDSVHHWAASRSPSLPTAHCPPSSFLVHLGPSSSADPSHVSTVPRCMHTNYATTTPPRRSYMRNICVFAAPERPPTEPEPVV
jgi:hypothetical protein